MTFRLFGLQDETLRLKSFSSSTSGTKGTIRIVIETSDLSEYGWTLRALAEVQEGQRRKPKPEPKPKKAPLLALPAPLRALPAPDREE